MSEPIKGKLKSIQIEKLVNGFKVEFSFEDKSEKADHWDDVDEEYAFATLDEVIVKVKEFEVKF